MAEPTEAQKKATRLGDFELKRKLGQGGMGVVYLAHQVSLDRDCALKVLSKELAAKPAFVERFIREARSMAKINHPHVVSCYAVDQDQGHHFVAMELIDGQSMQDWVRQVGPLSVPDALLVTMVCADALHYAHGLNMVHRDVKPDNILVTKKGIVKVSDLGLAKAIDEVDVSLTQSGTGLGTPLYMAPEQARNAKHVDRRCDVYALGSTLYYFLTGQAPFSGDSLLELIQNKEKGRFTAAHRLNEKVPERLSLMIDKAIANDLKARYQSCAEFLSDLEALGMAGESLSFIDDADRAVIGLGNRRPSSRNSSTRSAALEETRVDPERRSTGATMIPTQDALKADWYVRHEGKGGKVQIGRMRAEQVLVAMKSDKLNARTQIAASSKGPFVPLSQVPVFEEEARKMVTRQSVKSRDAQVAAEYKKLARQYDRRKIWRFLGNLVNGTLGTVGLILWLALIAGILVGLYYLIPWLYEMLASRVGLDK